MTIASIINSTGLVLDILGALLIFFNSPKLEATTFIGASSTDTVTERKNKIAKAGMGLIATGFILQLISNFIK
jgi:hypothetical protein